MSTDDEPGAVPATSELADPQTGENTCPDCAGTGRRDGGECPTCGGAGVVVELAGDA
jgi:DnaJ-class molecular chaperone